MKDLLLQQVHVIDPGGPHHDKIVDLLVKKGTITAIGARVPADGARAIRIPGAHISPGWVDLRAHFRDPGEEYKEDLFSGLDAAAAGGFTAVAVLPGTQPPVDSRAGVEYLLRKAQGHAVRVLPLAALSKGLQGEQLAELYDLSRAGALAFTDDQRATASARLMVLALQYAGGIGRTVMTFAQEAGLAHGGQMHEGPMSARLGLKGIAPEAETIVLARDLSLAAYADAPMHVATVSTAQGVAMIREAKQRKVKVTASVAAHHLLLDDGCLRGFDTHYKVMPPLRDMEHMEALREGVKDGTIDAVVSDHRPEDVEHKQVEFGHAAFGIIGLETSYAVASTALRGRMRVGQLVDRFCQGPRRVLGLAVPHIAEGAQAEITLFDPDADWTLADADLRSRSRNTPFLGQRFTGRPLGIIARGNAVIAGATD